MNIVNIDRRLVFPARYHGTRSLDGGFQLRSGDVPVVAAEGVFIADAGVLDFAFGRRKAVFGALGFRCCESGGGEEEEEESEEFPEGWHDCGLVVVERREMGGRCGGGMEIDTINFEKK